MPIRRKFGLISFERTTTRAKCRGNMFRVKQVLCDPRVGVTTQKPLASITGRSTLTVSMSKGERDLIMSQCGTSMRSQGTSKFQLSKYWTAYTIRQTPRIHNE